MTPGLPASSGPGSASSSSPPPAFRHQSGCRGSCAKGYRIIIVMPRDHRASGAASCSKAYGAGWCPLSEGARARGRAPSQAVSWQRDPPAPSSQPVPSAQPTQGTSHHRPRDLGLTPAARSTYRGRRRLSILPSQCGQTPQTGWRQVVAVEPLPPLLLSKGTAWCLRSRASAQASSPTCWAWGLRQDLS